MRDTELYQTLLGLTPPCVSDHEEAHQFETGTRNVHRGEVDPNPWTKSPDL